MSELDLKMPPPPPPPKAKRGPPSLLSIFTALGVVLCAVGIWIYPPSGATFVPTHPDNDQGWQPPFDEDIFLRLKKAGAYAEAARLLSPALGEPSLSSQRRAELLKRRGDLWRLAEDHQRALSDYFHAESINPEADNDLASELSRAIVELLRRMGRYDTVGDELRLKNRKNQNQNTRVKDPIVAEVDGEKLRLSEFRREVDLAVERQWLALNPDTMSEEDSAKAKEEIRRQLAAPGEQWKLLQQWASEEVLYREALQWEMDQHPDFEQQMDDVRRGLLARLLLREHVEKVELRDSDLDNFIKANPTKVGLSGNAEDFSSATLEDVKPKAREIYRQELIDQKRMAFQKDVMERHQVQLHREAFEEGSR